MSLILEALQRAEKERKPLDEVPGIDADHPTDEADSRASSVPTVIDLQSRTVQALLAALLLLLFFIAYLLMRDPSALITPAAPLTDDKSSRSEIAQPSIAPAIRRIPQAQPVPGVKVLPQAILKTGDVSGLYERARDDKILAAETDSNTSNEDLIDSASANPAESLSTFETGDKPVTDAPGFNDDIYAGLPFAKQLSDQQRSNIPAIRYTTHGYSPDSGAGIVTLNGRSLKVGDAVAPGLTLRDIKGEYIVVDMEGLLFRLPAAEDWVP